MTTPYACPECGGKLFLDPDAETDVVIVCKGIAIVGRPLTTLRIRVAVAFCSSCEFSLEIEGDKTP